MSSERNPGPETRLGYLLKHALQRYTELNDAALSALGIDGRELGILLTIAEAEPRSQQEIAERLGVDRTTMVAMLDALETKGIVARRPHAADRRRNVIELTASGTKTVARAIAASDTIEAEFLAPLGDSAAFRAALPKLLGRA